MSYPRSSSTAKPAPVAPSDASRPPQTVPFDALNGALGPLLELVGTDVTSIFAEGFSVSSEEIRFVSATPVPDVEPIAVGDDSEWQEYGWPVTVKVDRP